MGKPPPQMTLDRSACFPAVGFASRIIDALKSPISLAAGKATIGASIGIALFPEDSNNLDELMNIADKAMYVSKHQSRNRYTLMGSVEPAK